MNPDEPKTPREALELRLTALVLGELPAAEELLLRKAMEQDAELARLHARLKFTAELVRECAASPAAQSAAQPPPLRLSNARREKLLAHFKTVTPPAFAPPRRRAMSWLLPAAATAAVLMIVAALMLPALSRAKFRGATARNVIVRDMSSQATESETDGDLNRPVRPAAASRARRASELYEFGPAAASSPAVATAAPATLPPPPVTVVLPSPGQQVANPPAEPGVENRRDWWYAGEARGRGMAEDVKRGEQSEARVANRGVVSTLGDTPQAGRLFWNDVPGQPRPAVPAITTAGEREELSLRGAGDEINTPLVAGTLAKATPVPTKPELMAGVAIADGTVMAEDRKAADKDFAAGGYVYFARPAAEAKGLPEQPPADGALTLSGGNLYGTGVVGFNGGGGGGVGGGFGGGGGGPGGPGGGAADSFGVAPAAPARPTGDRVERMPEAQAGPSTITLANSASVLLERSLKEEMPASNSSYRSRLVEVEQAWQAPPVSGHGAIVNADAEARNLSVITDDATRQAIQESIRREVTRTTNVAFSMYVQPTQTLRLGRYGTVLKESAVAPDSSGIVTANVAPATPPAPAGTADVNSVKLGDLDVPAVRPSVPIPVPQPEIQTGENPFSTFSLNVSDVSFKLAAASLEKGALPEPGSIRVEEFINAFDYRDPEAAPGAPVAFAWERARYPFAHNRDLLRFSVKTAAAGRQPGRALNLVLLLDNSGSMERADRVRIIREALRVLAGQLQPQDRLSVVTFARTARLWVDGVAGNEAGAVAEQVGELTPQGGTNLEEALNLAYQTALRHYLSGGMNRVVLLTDGAANLGNVDPELLKQKVEAHRRQGIALDCFGIGWEGYNDDLLEVLTRNGDGRYGFINTPEEAATGFAAQLAGALKPAAADVKVQVEFNPKRATAYRQLGYAKHQLTKEQFRDNTVDAAEIAAAEAGNALYVVEVNPGGEGPLGTVRVRYRLPGTMAYYEHEWVVPYAGGAVALDQAGPAMRLAAAAGAFGEWLASSPFAGEVAPDRLLPVLNGVPEVFGADPRPRQLEWMIRQAGSVAGR